MEEQQSATEAIGVEVGEYVTILNYQRNPKDHSFRGDIYKVTAIDWPFIRLLQFYPKDGKLIQRDGMTLDLRIWDLMRWSPEFMDALEQETPTP